MNEVLEKFEEFKFAGIEEVYFIGFVVVARDPYPRA